MKKDENNKSLGIGNPNRINWFPGHMKKALMEAENRLKAIDLVLEVRDARMPEGSGNSDLEKRLNGKARLIIFNKERYAEPGNFRRWQEYLTAQGVHFQVVDALDQQSVKKIIAKAKSLGRAKQDKFIRRGIKPPPLRMMVMGLPNTGKSTLINRFKGKRTVAVGDRPGVTQNQRWVILDGLELVDTPGIMPPRIDSDQRGLGLCSIYAIRDEVPGKRRVAEYLAQLIIEQKPGQAYQRYSIPGDVTETHQIFEAAVSMYGGIKKGGEIDWNKIYANIINDYRKGYLGKLTFEEPPTPENNDAPDEATLKASDCDDF